MPTRQLLQKMAYDLDKKSHSLEELKKRNEDLMNQLQEFKNANIQQRVFRVDEISEAETRSRYIDVKSTFSAQPFKDFGGGVGNLFRNNRLLVTEIMNRVTDIRRDAQEVL